jgi:DNA-binding MarR family transcriptional regulator
MSELNLQPPHLGPDRNFAFQMASIIFKLEQELRDSTLRKQDITYIHFRVLQYLIEDDGKQIGEIARATAVRPPVLSRVVSQMEERSLVRRQVDPIDNRITRVYLTAHGRQKYAQAWPAAHKLIHYALEVLEPEDRKRLGASMRKMYNHVCDP